MLRFVPPVAALSTQTVVFDGDEQARARPIAPLLNALRGLGVDLDGDGLPFSVRGSGAVDGGTVEIDASGSSQFVSGLLLSGASFTDGLTIVHTGESVPSAPHVAMTVAMLRDAGVDVDDTQANRWRVSPGPISARQWVIEPDLSNAVPFLAAAVASGGIVRIAGWPSASTQPADAILGILEKLGAVVRHSSSYLEAQGAQVYGGFDVDLHDVGELAPAVAALAALASPGSVSKLTGIAHLRGHETDRLAALSAEINGPGRTLRGNTRRSGHHRALVARRPMAVLRRPPDGDGRCDHRAADTRRGGRRHRHHREDTAGFPADVGRHAGRPGDDARGMRFEPRRRARVRIAARNERGPERAGAEV